MPKPILVLENIRSAYNVGTMIRTADALGREVICSGFTPSPDREPKVKKTSLGAEEHVQITAFVEPNDAIESLRAKNYLLIAAEVTEHSVPLDTFASQDIVRPLAVVVGSETTGVLPETLAACQHIVHIPMRGYKESLNVAEAASIMMRALQTKAAS